MNNNFWEMFYLTGIENIKVIKKVIIRIYIIHYKLVTTNNRNTKNCL